jgi:hypothetical protein
MNAEQFAEYWLAALDDPDRIWPEDVLTDDEWNRGWFDREVIAGRRTEEERINWPPGLGGTGKDWP